jgi:hypothetical protein
MGLKGMEAVASEALDLGNKCSPDWVWGLAWGWGWGWVWGKDWVWGWG